MAALLAAMDKAAPQFETARAAAAEVREAAAEAAGRRERMSEAVEAKRVKRTRQKSAQAAGEAPEPAAVAAAEAGEEGGVGAAIKRRPRSATVGAPSEPDAMTAAAKARTPCLVCIHPEETLVRKSEDFRPSLRD